MGTYLNPGNEGFATVRRGTYVDKSGLIDIVNGTIDTKQKLTCISRPRRFGKSIAAQMLCAYYDKGCDSSQLFDDLEIAGKASYHEHLNRYDVIYVDITDIIGITRGQDILAFINENLKREIAETYSVKEEYALNDTMIKAVEKTGNKFIAIIDEWDAPVRDNAFTGKEQKEYLEFLRMLFKSSGKTDKIFAAAYMTGILPIKKDGSQSAISEFEEYNMLGQKDFEPYVGFTEEEVRSLCQESDVDFDKMKRWYDGYSLQYIKSIYNPNSVMHAIRNKSFKSYWQMSSAADSLLSYINMDFDGLGEMIPELLGGKEIVVEVNDFQNDVRSLTSKDDVLTLLIHFGYLSYDEMTGMVRIPNEEIRQEFSRSVRKVKHTETIRRVKESDKLIEDTINMDAEAVAAQIEKVHTAEYSPRLYNNEQSLRGVIKLAYFAYKDNYLQLEELAGGTGYADIVFLPKPGRDLPALVVELKWNRDAQGAISQIKDRNYPEVLKGYVSDILLVGISYDKDDQAKKHHCVIEEFTA